jgi:TRAP transporter 4TM/12TM fusion protein
MAENQRDEVASSVSAGEIVAQVDTGARHPTGAVARILLGTAFAWSVFQLWISSPLPFIFRFGVLNNTESRAIHLAFAIFLAYLAFPALKRSPRDRIPIQDWVFAVLGAFTAAYIFLFYDQLASRPGSPTTFDLTVAIVGMVVLLEATRRALGPPLMIVAIVFLVYTFGGQWMPDVIAHKGQSLHKVMSHQWLTTEGVFGVALGVSTDFVFLFVLFGAMLEHAGAGNYFIKMAFSLLGHMRGGPAKAAVVASAATGLISGSSIANVATTGTFTIPLMKRVGFPGYKAGAVEVAASTNGQLTPPVMGAAAFLMIEYVGISYIEVIKHALLPALISYVALVYIVHLEALKANMQGFKRRHPSTLAQKLMMFAAIVVGLCLIGLGVYYGVGWVKTVAGDAALPIIVVAIVFVYLGLLAYSTRFPELVVDDPNSALLEMPEPGPTVKVGLYFLLPIVILMWCLVVERFSPATAAFWATLFMIFIVVTQRPLLALMRRHGDVAAATRQGLKEFVDGMISGARNMIGIGVATAAAGIVVGTITLTGIGQVMVGFVEFISGGNLLLALLFTAAICIVLGMGLPTTANYIVVSSLMAPVVVAIGQANGLLVPLIAVHLFVFYFGILADDTPPVGLAAFAASAIAKSDPIRTGIQGFAYDIRTAVLPFMFIFNTQLLLIGLTNAFELILTIVTALIAMLVFAAATQGYWMVKSRWWETAGLLLVAFTLFRPGFWWDMVQPPLDNRDPAAIEQLAESAPADGALRMVVQGETLDGDFKRITLRLPLGAEGPGAQRLQNAGLAVRVEDDGKVYADDVMFGSAAQRAGLDFDWEIVRIETPADRLPKELMFLPALLVLALLWKVQMSRRRSVPAGQSAESAA